MRDGEKLLVRKIEKPTQFLNIPRIFKIDARLDDFWHGRRDWPL